MEIYAFAFISNELPIHLRLRFIHSIVHDAACQLLFSGASSHVNECAKCRFHEVVNILMQKKWHLAKGTILVVGFNN